MSKPARYWLWVALLVFGVATVGKAAFNELFDDFKRRGEDESLTVEQARRRGILVTELVADPPELEVMGGRIYFGRAWIEERSLPTHRFVWIPVEERIGGYRLHFTIDRTDRVDELELRHWTNDTRLHVLSITQSDAGTIHCVLIDQPDVASLRISFGRSFNNPQAKSIRFVPKP